MNKKIVIAGGTGFIGKYLTTQLRNLGYEVIITSRQKDNIQWNDSTGIINTLENSILLINLAGKSVDCRYNKKNKEEILKSRTETTKALGKAILQCNHPPELWIIQARQLFIAMLRTEAWMKARVKLEAAFLLM